MWCIVGCRTLPRPLRVLHFTSTSPRATGVVLIAANKRPILHAPATFLTRLLLLRRWLTQSPGLQPNACAAVPPERPTHSCRHAIPTCSHTTHRLPCAGPRAAASDT